MKGFTSLPVSLIPVIAIMFILLFLPVSGAMSAEGGGFQFKKIDELQRIQPRKPVKIKLKRSVKGRYSWEISGNDADEILKTDRELRKVLRNRQKQEDHDKVRR